MTPAAWTMIGVACVCMAIDWWAVHHDRARAEQFAKPAVMLALIATTLVGTTGSTSLRLVIVAALLFGLIGDLALLPRFDAFIVGLGSFLIGHVLYVVAFTTIWKTTLLIIAGALGAAALIVMYGRPIERSIQASALRFPVIAYMGVTCALIVAGAGTGSWVITGGALAFALSDGLLGSNKFVAPAPGRRVWVHVLYHLGQVAIVVGMLAA